MQKKIVIIKIISIEFLYTSARTRMCVYAVQNITIKL